MSDLINNTKLKNTIYYWFFLKTNNTRIQLIRYFFVGGVAPLFSILALFIFTSILNIYYILSNIMGFVIGLTVNYYLTKKIVFTDNVKINSFFEYGIYAIIGFIGLIVDTLFLWYFTSIIGLFYMTSKVISTTVVFLWNFTARKILYLKLEK